MKIRTDFNVESPEPGIYSGVSHTDYIRAGCPSRSTFQNWNEDPQKIWEDVPQTDSQIFGGQYHTLLLEPDQFNHRYEIGTKERRSAADITFFKEQCERLGGPEYVIRPQQLEMMNQMKALFDHPRYKLFKELLMGEGGISELTVVALHEESGIVYKTRIDRYLPDVNWIVDLKTSADASRDAFTRSIRRYWYDKQAAMYVDSLRYHGVDVNGFVVVAQGKKPPFWMNSFRIPDAWMDTARYVLDDVFASYILWSHSKAADPNEAAQIIDIEPTEDYTFPY